MKVIRNQHCEHLVYSFVLGGVIKPLLLVVCSVSLPTEWTVKHGFHLLHSTATSTCFCIKGGDWQYVERDSVSLNHSCGKSIPAITFLVCFTIVQICQTMVGLLRMAGHHDIVAGFSPCRKVMGRALEPSSRDRVWLSWSAIDILRSPTSPCQFQSHYVTLAGYFPSQYLCFFIC